MPYLSSSDYIKAREAYTYTDFDVTFNIVQTGTLPYVGEFRGIFPRVVPLSHPTGINIRKFEIICSSVFCDANFAEAKKSSTPIHIANLKAVICAIVHWKMASQGGRAPRNEQNVLNKWQSNTYAQLLEAYKPQLVRES